ncbi:MAG TPA: dihydrolipoyl dehydrogenase [Casimicrobiaceae bacterium]|nr:dihydrolipoyl dehydrogenase [Casimicrobiaceae bacterium]
MRTIETDVAVIGAGTAGLAAYRAAKAAGRTALLIEGGPYGTTCARVGCMPSKLLIAPAEAAHSVARFEAFGLRLNGEVDVDGKAVMERVRRERDRFVGFVLRGVDGIPQADRIRGFATFRNDTTLVVDGVVISARAVVIATGSSPAYPPIWSALGNRLVTNETIFEWTDLPRCIAVFGPGVIGLELGQALFRLGVRVKIFGRGGGVGPLSDPALIDEARRIFQDELYLDTDAHADVSPDGERVLVRYRGRNGQVESEHFDYLLAATGRVPKVRNLGLESTSVALDARGVPLFDRETLQCGTTPIFIAGDATADVPVLHEAADEGRIAGENAARFPDVRAGMRRAGLSIVFTDPQIAVVGGGFREASQTTFVTGAVSFDDQGRARVMQRNRGRLHVYADAASGVLLGAEMIGPDAEHLAHLLAWSRQLGLTISEMLALPFYHPVVEEGLRTALRDAFVKLDAASRERRAA